MEVYTESIDSGYSFYGTISECPTMKYSFEVRISHINQIKFVSNWLQFTYFYVQGHIYIRSENDFLIHILIANFSNLGDWGM